MNNKMTRCKACGQEIAKSAKSCPLCGAKNKKSIYKRWWFWAIIVLIAVFAISGSSSGKKNNDFEKVDESSPKPTTQKQTETEESIPVESTTDNTEKTEENMTGSDENVENSAKSEYRVGDVVMDGNVKIVFMSSGEYKEENQFMQPAEGKKYIYLQFAFENLSDNRDASVSTYGFECFADGYAADMYYGGEDTLSATLSAGRSTTGYLYYEVPSDAQVIEIEYEPNMFTEEKIKFIYEGDKDSGYVQESNNKTTEGAFVVGDTVASDKLKITYLSCDEYVSDNMFIAPADGYRFISCEFEFENIGMSDELVSSFDFDCYADGAACEGSYVRDDNLSATISAGRKAKGTVTFEVPIDAEVIEVEYLSNYWTSNRVVFIVK